jgi:hypothetical protein
VEIGSDGDWEPNKIEGSDVGDNAPQIQVYIPSAGKPVSITASKEDLAEIESEGIDKYLEKHPEPVEYNDLEENQLVWEVAKPE